MRVPSGLKVTLFTYPLCPVSVLPICSPEFASQMRMVLSELPLAMRVPSGLKATLFTDQLCPVSGSPICSPELASQMRMVLSELPLAMRVPSGLKATLNTIPPCPRMTCSVFGSCWIERSSASLVWKFSSCLLAWTARSRARSSFSSR